MIRAVRPTDLVALRAFLQRAGVVEVTTHTWPKVQPESGHLPVGPVLGQVLNGQGGRHGVWVALEEGQVVGYAAARGRCDGSVWDVEHLHTTQPEAGIDLLEHVCANAVEAGALRVFLEVPVDSLGIELGRKAGFQRYAAATTFKLTPPFRVDKNRAFAARPRLRADEHGLFQLYTAAVPAQVRAAEAMTYEEWSALHQGSKKWAPSLFGDRHQFVWEMGAAGVIGWMIAVYGQKSQFLELLVHPHYESMLDGLRAYALTQVSDKAPVYAAARDYQPALASALQRARFEPSGEVEILVRQLAARVPEPKLMPAEAIGA
jgi:hypothetical protein